jgi:DNA-binding CsgD family transcriptional regulator
MTAYLGLAGPGTPDWCATGHAGAGMRRRTSERPGRHRRAAGVPTLVGREEERRRVEHYVDSVPSGAAPLVIVGEAGIGKSTLWTHGVARARAHGYAVLRSRPTEDECREPAAGLADLFDRLDARHGALRTSVAAVVAADTPPVERGRRTLDCLRELAAPGPVLLAIDDLQWLDAVSAKALRFALTRLSDEPVGLLATARVPTTGFPPAPPTFPDAELLHVGPMRVSALRRVLSAVTAAITVPDLMRAYQLSNGNPMLAIELVRSWERRGPTSDIPPLRALADRVSGLDPDAAAVARALAVGGPQPAPVIAVVSGVADLQAAVRAGVQAGILHVEDDFTIRYSHALYASAVLGSTTALERAALHARLAATVTDPDVADRHLAYATDQPDEHVAERVDAAAARWARRGAFDVAADLAAHSARLTPPELDEASAERSVRAVSYRAASGDTARALVDVERLSTTLRPGRPRAEALTLRVFLHSADSERFLTEALEHAGHDRLLRAHVLDLLGWQIGYYRGRLADGVAYSAAALDAARGVPDAEQVVMRAEATLSMCSTLMGRPAPEAMARALALDDTNPAAPLGRWPPIYHARQLLWAGELDTARQVFEQMRRRAIAVGSEFQRPYRLYELALVDIAAGDLTAALDSAEEAIDAARDAGNDQALAWAAYPLGLIAAHQGEDERAQWAAEVITDWQATADEMPRQAMAAEILGTLAATHGDWAGALTRFEHSLAVLDCLGFAHPGARPALPRAVEAAAMLGDESRCAALTHRLAAQAAPLAAPWVDAQLAYAHGNLAALRGANREAVELLEQAATSLDCAGYRLDAARVRLVLARVWCRLGQRTKARGRAEQARDAFAAAPATPWVTVADDLGRRAGARSAGDALTASETEIAALVAAGRSNREIAAQLYIGVSTVEAHLTRIYRKLGLRGRTELSRWVHSAS